jgi:hypothetical protein
MGTRIFMVWLMRFHLLWWINFTMENAGLGDSYKLTCGKICRNFSIFSIFSHDSCEVNLRLLRWYRQWSVSQSERRESGVESGPIATGDKEGAQWEPFIKPSSSLRTTIPGKKKTHRGHSPLWAALLLLVHSPSGTLLRNLPIYIV